MKETQITGNGDFNITINGIRTLNGESTIHVPSVVGGASIALGWIDELGTFNVYKEQDDSDSILVASDAKRTRHGSGVRLAVQVTGFTTAFSIGIAPQ